MLGDFVRVVVKRLRGHGWSGGLKKALQNLVFFLLIEISKLLPEILYRRYLGWIVFHFLESSDLFDVGSLDVIAKSVFKIGLTGAGKVGRRV